MFKVYKWCFLALYLTASLFAAETQYKLMGTVKDEDGAAIKDAIVSLAGNATLKDTTDDKGAFILSNVTAIKFRGAFNVSAEKSAGQIGIKSNYVQFNLQSAAEKGNISIFSSNGKRSVHIPLGRMEAGVQKLQLPELAPGFYVMNIAINNSVVSSKLVNTGNDIFVSSIASGSEGRSAGMAKIFADGVDTLIVEKAELETAKLALTANAAGAFIDTAIEIVLKAPGPVECKPTQLPESSALTYDNAKLPSPWEFFDGTEMTRKDEWECRRQEILDMAQKYIYGPCPPKPDSVWGTVSGGNIKIECKQGSKTASFSASISGSGEAICLQLSGGIYPGNAKKLSLGSGNRGKIESLYGVSGMIDNLANAWMVDRVIDVLKLNPESGHDPDKLMVSGCSGCGKGAFLVGVFSHIPLTVIVESGGGGAANLRQTEWFRHGGAPYQCADAKPQGIDNLEDSGICGPWVSSVASWLRKSPAKLKNLPFDQHLLLACIAPRYLCHVTNQHGKNEWCHLGGTGEALSSWAAKPVFKALGIPENHGFVMYTESGAPAHCGNPGSAKALANEFFKRVFDGDETAKTDVWEANDQDLQQSKDEWKAMWVDWDMEKELK